MGINFEIMETFCHPLDIVYCIINPSSNDNKFYTLSHTEYDGFGGAIHLTKQLYGKEITDQLIKSIAFFSKNIQKQFSFKEKYQFFKQIVYDSLMQRTTQQYWEKYNPALASTKDDPADMAWHIFTEAETKTIIKNFNKLISSALLFTLHQVTKKHLLSDNENENWLLTVDMRRYVENKTSMSNCMSIAPINMKNIHSPHLVYKNILQSMIKKRHWLYWFRIHSIKYTGFNIHKFFLKRVLNHLKPIGIFSYTAMGTLANKSIILGAPPPSPFYPIGAGTGICNNQLFLALRLHPTLMKSRDEISQCCNEWVDNLRALANISLDK
ncbi:MAG: hypothetical protein ABSF18_03325 [Gammaproteobacteria bacterium]|jgi:hypothetical protein